jgi:uncharacterized protein YbjT (DUF2867 family)
MRKEGNAWCTPQGGDGGNGLILVIGATGTQGGAVARELLAQGHRVRFLSRDTDSPAARRLAAAGAEPVRGDLGKLKESEAVFQGVSGVFAIPPLDGSGEDRQLSYGRDLVQGAIRAGVRSFVQTTASGIQSSPEPQAPPETLIYRQQKLAVEAMVREAGFEAWTVLRPAWIMENWLSPKADFMYPLLKQGKIVTVIRPELKLDFVAAATIGKFARAAFEQPALFNGKIITLADEAVSMQESVETVNRILGKSIRLFSLSPQEAVAAGLNPTMVVNHNYMNQTGFCYANIEELKAFKIPLTSFQDWVREHRDEIDAD